MALTSKDYEVRAAEDSSSLHSKPSIVHCCIRCGGDVSVFFRRSPKSRRNAKDAAFCDSCFNKEQKIYEINAEKKKAANVKHCQEAANVQENKRKDILAVFKEKVGADEQIESIIECRIEAPIQTKRINSRYDYGRYGRNDSEIVPLTVSAPLELLGIRKISDHWMFCKRRAELFLELWLASYFHIDLDEMKIESFKAWIKGFDNTMPEALVPVTQFVYFHVQGKIPFPASFFHMRKIKKRWMYCKNREEYIESRGLFQFLRVEDPRICVFRGLDGFDQRTYSSMNFGFRY